MANKPGTRLVHDEADLDRLVEGDRVRIDFCSDYDDNQFSALVAYAGRVGQRVLFLGRNSEYRTRIDQFSLRIKDLSYDPDGMVVASLARARWKSYDSSSSEYQSKLVQLRKEGM